MQIKYTPTTIWVCRDCNFLDITMTIDKCPCCGGDDWIAYTKEKDEDE